MKKIIGIAFMALFLGLGTVVGAQEKTTGEKVESGAKKAGKGVKKGAKAVGKKSAEVGSKTKAKVTDQVYKEKIGPNGETIYIDNTNRYYWIDKKGHKHYLPYGQLKDKPKD
jgi:hypothetical protein